MTCQVDATMFMIGLVTPIVKKFNHTVLYKRYIDGISLIRSGSCAELCHFLQVAKWQPTQDVPYIDATDTARFIQD